MRPVPEITVVIQDGFDVVGAHDGFTEVIERSSGLHYFIRNQVLTEEEFIFFTTGQFQIAQFLGANQQTASHSTDDNFDATQGG